MAATSRPANKSTYPPRDHARAKQPTADKRAPSVDRSGPNVADDIESEIGEVVADPATWLDTPNSQFGERKPRELIGTSEENKLRNYVNAIKYGLF